MSRSTKRRVGDSFTLPAQFAFGHGCDHPSYVRHEDNPVRASCNDRIALATGGIRWKLAVDMRPWLLIFTALLAVLLSGCTSCPKPVAPNPAPFQFDAANRLTNTISPLGHSTSVVFNHQGLPTLITDPANQTTTNTFDGLGRLITRGDKVATTTNAYDGNNNLTNVFENGKTNVWTYDAYNHVSSYRDTSGNLIQYRYDANGNLTNLIYPGNRTVAYAYDSLNHLTNVTDWTGRKSSLAYDLDGHLTTLTRPNGTFRTLNYDAAGQVTNIWEQMANTLPIAWFRLNWTSSGNLAWEFAAPLPHSVTVPTRNMTYDADNQLRTVNGTNVMNDYDGNLTNGPLAIGNWPSAIASFTNYTYDARNRLLNAGGVINTYDALNTRISQAVGTNNTTYVVNPNAALPQVLMRIKNGTTNYYIYGVGLLYQVTETATSTNTLTYHYDYRGSTIALSTDSGLVTDRIEYSLYGLTTYRTGTNDTPFLFNGRFGVQTDPNGLLYMRARYYNPYLCRFINPDPSGFAGGLNFYAYANGNPASYFDPFGLNAAATGDTDNSSLYYNQLSNPASTSQDEDWFDKTLGYLTEKYQAYPGQVVGVNVPLQSALGATDADILLQNAVIQVKSGGSAQGLLLQLQKSEAATGLPSIGFGPNLPFNSLRTLSQQGGLVTGDENLLLQVVKP